MPDQHEGGDEMQEIHGRCLECGATITLPMPDAWNDHGEVTEADRTEPEEELGRMLAFLHDLHCPNCGEKAIRVALPDEEA
jgi:hypothetical protein